MIDVNDEGITEKWTDDEELRFLQAMVFHDILTLQFFQHAIPGQLQSPSEIRYVVIGNCFHMFLEEKHDDPEKIIVIPREFFLEWMRVNIEHRLNMK